jgi:hypothetical protein
LILSNFSHILGMKSSALNAGETAALERAVAVLVQARLDEMGVRLQSDWMRRKFTSLAVDRMAGAIAEVVTKARVKKLFSEMLDEPGGGSGKAASSKGMGEAF